MKQKARIKMIFNTVCKMSNHWGMLKPHRSRKPSSSCLVKGSYSTEGEFTRFLFSFDRKLRTIFFIFCYSSTFRRPILFLFIKLDENLLVSSLDGLRLRPWVVSSSEQTESLAELILKKSYFMRSSSAWISFFVVRLLSIMCLWSEIWTFLKPYFITTIRI